jgi:FtsZ-binding cell division protein ZapB
VASQSEKLIQALQIDVNTLKERVEALRGETAPVREITNQIAVIEHKLSELTKIRELWGQRGWMVLTICLSAFFSLLATAIGALLSSYLNSRR